MSLVPSVKENCPRTRAALLSYVARKLAALNKSTNLRAQLAAFLAPVPVDVIALALRPSAEDTAHQLADALLRHIARSDPHAAIADLIADTFPALRTVERARLIDLTQAVREIAIANDGRVEDRDLLRAGFAQDEAERLLPKAAQIIARLERRAAPEAERSAAPMDRLIEAGTRAGLRHDPQAMALAS